MEISALDRRVIWLFGISAAALVAMLLAPSIPQDPGYHQFADQRAWLGIPNFWKVVSNLPFVLVGWAGVREFIGRSPRGALAALRPAYVTFFVGIALIGPGSAYYHWAPDNASLLWDRLPMTIAFMAFLTLIIGEYISSEAGRAMLWPLVIAGVASVVYWAVTESSGHGDLRPYGLVQFLPMLLIPLILLWFRPKLSGSGYIWAMLLAYLAAKLAEWLDEPVFRLLAPLSGHSLKHLLAASGTYSIVLAVRRRRPLD